MNKNNQDNIDFANEMIVKTRTQPKYWLDVVKMVRTASDIIKQQAVSLDQWIRMSEDAADLKDGNYWSWQGDGEDHLQSMSCEMKVLISADDLRELSSFGEELATIRANRSKCIDTKHTDNFDRAMDVL